MMHLSLSSAQCLLKNLLTSQAKYMLITSHNIKMNPLEDCGTPILQEVKNAFCFRQMNLFEKPFSVLRSSVIEAQTDTYPVEQICLCSISDSIVVSGLFGNNLPGYTCSTDRPLFIFHKSSRY
jgi:hypothetical protein